MNFLKFYLQGSVVSMDAISYNEIHWKNVFTLTYHPSYMVHE
jgi:hypothetical protein